MIVIVGFTPVTFILEKRSDDAFKCSLTDYFCPTHFFLYILFLYVDLSSGVVIIIIIIIIIITIDSGKSKL